MKRLLVAVFAAMMLVGFNAVAFADEKGEHKGMEMKGEAKGGETKVETKSSETKGEAKGAKKEEKKAAKGEKK